MKSINKQIYTAIVNAGWTCPPHRDLVIGWLAAWIYRRQQNQFWSQQRWKEWNCNNYTKLIMNKPVRWELYWLHSKCCTFFARTWRKVERKHNFSSVFRLVCMSLCLCVCNIMNAVIVVVHNGPSGGHCAKSHSWMQKILLPNRDQCDKNDNN